MAALAVVSMATSLIFLMPTLSKPDPFPANPNPVNHHANPTKLTLTLMSLTPTNSKANPCPKPNPNPTVTHCYSGPSLFLAITLSPTWQCTPG